VHVDDRRLCATATPIGIGLVTVKYGRDGRLASNNADTTAEPTWPVPITMNIAALLKAVLD
jgi:hypothetical protein